MGKVVEGFEDELLFDVTVAPAVSLEVSKPSSSRRAPLIRGIGEVSVNLLHGDCLEMMRTLPDNSVDSVVTDPPYGLANCSSALITETMIKWASGDREFVPEGAGFMGKSWDSFVPPPAVWDEVFRVLKPGGHVLAFAGSRTQDLMGLSIRLAGFEIRDSVAWLYGSGFPKSMDVSKAIDKMHGAEREVIGKNNNARPNSGRTGGIMGEARGAVFNTEATAPATDDAINWEGWGTALKPAYEPVIMARKPLSEGTVAANVLLHGTGAINIDASRIETVPGDYDHEYKPAASHIADARSKKSDWRMTGSIAAAHTDGRFPANILLDKFTAELVDGQSGVLKSGAPGIHRGTANNGAAYGAESRQAGTPMTGFGDQGGASRFFYVAKANKSERPVVDGVAHPTVKPIDVMRWLIKLVTPPGGTVLEPFAGSGTTVEAAIIEKFDVVAIEREDSYIPLIEARVARQMNGGNLS